MCEYFFDEEHGIAYKIDPVATTVVDGGTGNPTEILVHTDVKVTNVRKEKIRRTLSELYPSDQYDSNAAKKLFAARLLKKLVNGAKQISEDEYLQIKAKYEV